MQGENRMNLQLFAREDRSMMRSEKRESYNLDPHRKRRKKNLGLGYGIAAVIVSIIMWPAGMLMLWVKRLKWTVGVKLIASVLTLIMCLCWIGFGLTVQTDNPKVTYVQDKINGFLAETADASIEAAGKLADDVSVAATEVYTYACANLAPAVEWTGDIIGQGKDIVLGWFGVDPTEDKTTDPDTGDVLTDVPGDDASAEPTATPRIITNTPAPARVTPKPTQIAIGAVATPEIPAPSIKPAGEAIVYHTSNGVGYHRASRCVGMSSAKPYTLAESVADGLHACGNCKVPDESILDCDEPVMWVDKSDIYHMSDECASFDGKWTLMPLTEAGEAGCQPCPDCGAEKYIYVAPTPEPTAEPTPVPDNSELPHKTAGELIVYHTSNGRSYHASEKCRTMSGAQPYTLAESVADGFGACGLCDVPHESIVDDPVIWLDENEVGHISDLCTYFEGKCTLVSIYDAVKTDIAGCPYCGAGDYLAGETERLMELAKTAVVYYNNQSTYYHKANTCVNMRSASEHTLYDALEKGLKYCKECCPAELSQLDAPAEEAEAEQPE